MLPQNFPIHPVIVHFPLALAVVVPFLALALSWTIRAGALPARAWVITVALAIAGAGSSFVAMWAGEQDEDKVEDVVGKPAIHEHEEKAEVFAWTFVALAAVALAGALPQARKLHGPLHLATAVGGIAVLALGMVTGHSGGELVYEKGAASAYVKAAGSDRTGAAPAAGEAVADEERREHEGGDDD